MNCSCVEHRVEPGFLIEGKSFETRQTFAHDKSVMMDATVRLVGSLRGNLDQKLIRDSRAGYKDLKEEFSDSLFGIFKSYRSGSITIDEMEKQWRASIRDAWEEAYKFGNGSVGNPFGLKLWDEDKTWLKGATGEEFGYLSKFIRDIRNDTLKMDAEKRLGMYVNTLDGIYHHGQVEGSPDYARIWWVLREAKHCDDCIRLAAGSPYTKKTLPGVPRDGLSRCLCITTPSSRVLTNRGWVPIVEVIVGDLVLTHKNRWRPVSATPRNPSGPAHKQAYIRGSNDIWVGCTSDHRFLTFDGWKDLVYIDNNKLPVYTIEYEENMYPLRNWNEIGSEEGLVCPMCEHLSLWDAERSTSRRMHLLRNEQEGKIAVGGHGDQRQTAQGYTGGGFQETDQFRGFNGSLIYGDEAGREEVRLLLGQEREEKIHIPVSVEMDQGIRTDSHRDGHSSQRRDTSARLGRKLGVNETASPYFFAYGDESNREAVQNMRDLRENVSEVGPGGRTTSPILFHDMSERGIQKAGSMADHSLPDLRERCSGSVGSWPSAKILFPELLRDCAKQSAENASVCLMREDVHPQARRHQKVTFPQTILLQGMLQEGTILYDLTVEDDHSFIIEGLITHNSKCKCILRIDYKGKPEPGPSPKIVVPRPPRIPEGLTLPTAKEYDHMAQMSAEIDRLRGLIASTSGDLKKEYIQARKELNQELINYADKKKVYYVPKSGYIQSVKPKEILPSKQARATKVEPPEGYRLPSEKEKERIDKMATEVVLIRSQIVLATGLEKKALIVKRHEVNQDMIDYMEKKKIYYIPPIELGIEAGISLVGPEVSDLLM